MALWWAKRAGDREQRNDPPDPRVYLAAERTLLAWVRTGLAMMGLGCVIILLGLLLRQLATVRAMLVHQHSGPSLWVGAILVIFGIAINVGAAVKHWTMIRRLRRGQPLRPSSSLGIVVALLLALLGLLIVAYLVFGCVALRADGARGPKPGSPVVLGPVDR